MLAINNSSSNEKKVTPNLLPCSVKHSGPVNAAKRYWNPSAEEDGSNKAYFRGRKLLGRKVAVPKGYQGVVLEKTDKLVLEKPNMAALAAMEVGDGEELAGGPIRKEVETKTIEPQGTFDELLVWGHEAVPEDDDLYVKGMQEWVGFAEAIHSYDDSESQDPSWAECFNVYKA